MRASALHLPAYVVHRRTVEVESRRDRDLRVPHVLLFAEELTREDRRKNFSDRDGRRGEKRRQ